MQLQELNDRFTEVNTELLLCIACLCPDDSFHAFDMGKLIKLAKYYPNDFSAAELEFLRINLKTTLLIYNCRFSIFKMYQCSSTKNGRDKKD